MVRVGILSDTHLTVATAGFRKMVEAAFRDVDMLIHAGDMTSVEVLEYLSNWDLKAVRGNMDDLDLRALLPDKRVEELEGRRVGIIHGRGSPYGIQDLVLTEFGEVDLIIFGHSHVPLHASTKGISLFNPGSPKGTHLHPGTVGVLEIDREMRLTHLRVG